MEDAAAKLKPKINQNPNNFLTNNFLYRTTLVIVFLILLPLFPFQAPQFINQTVNSRSWELIQFIFVGIALSYGLFSKKNDDHDEIEKQLCTSSKLDNAQTYVSKLLEVSSVFDDDDDDQNVIDDHKVQAMWNSQHYREEPLVVMAKENPVLHEDNNANGVVIQKPLLLPVRSLKQRRLIDDESSSSNSSSKNSTAIVFKKPEEKTEENVVLRSPIPWRSRSGNMEIEGNRDSPSEFGKLETRSFRPNPKSKNLSPSPSMSSSSPRKLLNSNSFSSQSKSSEDVVRKTSFSSSQLAPPPPPPPPPPPSPFIQKSMLVKSNSSTTNNSVSSEIKDDVSKWGNNVRRFTSSDQPIKVEEKNGYANNMINEKKPNILEENGLMENSDSEGESEEDDYFEERSGGIGEVENDNSLKDLGPDVDKKADEFIAKFREQIRLQRIESIRKSTAQRSAKNLR